MGTALDPLHSDDAPLIVYVDLKSPYAFVAMRPIIELEDALGLQFDWRPLTLNIESYLGSARLDKQDRVVESNRSAAQWTGVRYAYKDARRYAKLNGLTLRGTVKIWDTSLAHIGFMYARQSGPAALRRYLLSSYEHFWRRDLDAEDLAVVTEHLRRADVDTLAFSSFAAGEGRREHDQMQAEIFAAGIFGVPSFVVDGKCWFGREHLPLIAWHLQGKPGKAPDVAYCHVAAMLDPPRRTTASAIRGAAQQSESQPTLDKPPATRLRIAIDFKHPQAFLALEPTLRMLEACHQANAPNAPASELPTVEWLPLQVSPIANPVEPAADAGRTAQHLWRRARRQQGDIQHYAAIQGHQLRDLGRRDDSTLASLGLLFLARHAPSQSIRYLKDVFARYWTLDAPGACRLDHRGDVLAAISRAAQPLPEAERSKLLARADAFVDTENAASMEALAETQAILRESGLAQVPGYLVDDEPFHGRAHLPMIQWLLTAQQGPKPI